MRRYLFLLAALLAEGTVSAQFDLIPEKAVRTLQETVATSLPDFEWDFAKESVAKVLDAEGEWVASATAVRTNGWLLTKASDWPEGGRIRLPDGTEKTPVDIRRDATNDVALVRVEAHHLPILSGDATGSAEIGDWLMAYDLDAEEVRLGVLSARTRASDRESGYIGVAMGGEVADGVQVRQVYPDSGAAEAGVLPGDLLVAVNDTPVNKIEAVQEQIQQHDPGSRVRVTIRREEEDQELEILLGSRGVIFDLFNRNRLMSGPTSTRHSGFEQVLQHDLPLPREAVGLPLFDLDGHWIGITIARKNRVEGFALPAEVVKRVVDELLAQ